jgi:hypothetical protein
MTTHKTTWFTMAALLWLWAALAAAFSFSGLPALFNPGPGSVSPPYGSQDAYELYLFVVLALFIFFSHQNRKVWFTACGIGLLVLAKILWLGPLLYFRAQTTWEGQSPFDFLPALYLVSEIVKVGLLFITSYWIFRAWSPPAPSRRPTKGFLSNPGLGVK